MGRATQILISMVVGLAACGTPPGGEELPGQADLVFLETATGLAAFDSSSGEEQVALDGAVAASDWSVVASTEHASGVTTLTRADPAGKELERVDIDGDYVASVVSGSGRLVALTSPRSPGATPWLPDGRAQTEVVIADSSRDLQRFDLDGNFEPEAFSTDERELFMIEYIPAMAPDRYRVRRLKLATGKVAPIGRLKNAAPGQMQGTGRMQVYSPYGDELYTLYTQQADAGHIEHEGHGKDDSHAFVHLLNLDDSWAHCIDLPMPFGMGWATASALAISPDGRSLYVSDWSNGAVALVRPERVRVARTKRLELGAPDDDTFATAGRERLYLAGNSQIAVLDATTLDLIDRWNLPDEVMGLALSSDDERLHISLDGEIVTLDARTGERTDSVSVEDGGPIARVLSSPLDRP
ncbi:MAG: YncE family protein [Actinomycetota bacterium]